MKEVGLSSNLLTALVFVVITLQAMLTIISVYLFINRPLRKICTSMQKVQEGSLAEKCMINSGDEFADVGEHFNHMIFSIREISKNRKRIEEKLIKAEESLKYKMVLEDKAKLIEKMNHELTGAFNDISLLYTVSQYLSAILEVEELVESVSKIFGSRFSCDAFALYFLVGDDKVSLATSKGVKETKEGFCEFKSVDGIVRKVIQKKNSLFINDISKTKFKLSKIDKEFPGSVFALPLKVHGEIMGVLCVSRKSNFSLTDRQSLESISSQIAMAYERAKLYTKTKELAVRDELTGVYNRRHFQQMLNRECQRAERYGHTFSLLVLDVDKFKRFNDTYGHLKGDELLKKLTKVLQRNIREIDVLARFGGEEFVILLTDASLDDAVVTANKLRKIVKTQIKFDDLKVDSIGKDSFPVTVSIGASSFPDLAPSPLELINTADMALYMAKREGRDRVKSYQAKALPVHKYTNKIKILHPH